MASMNSLFSILLPKKKLPASGVAATPTYNPAQTTRTLTLPTYRDHLTDVFSSRSSDDTRTLMQQLFRMDPDVSATVNVFLTLANTQMTILVRDLEGQLDRDGMKQLHNLITPLVRPTDYTTGFTFKPNLAAICANMRYMLLLRGAIPVELVYDKKMQPSELRLIDAAALEWFESASGQYKPQQTLKDGKKVSLDLPQFFISFFRRDPLNIYTDSPFVASINTIAARQQVVNDLYRIMQKTGYPRMSVKVVEEVLQKSAPAAAKSDPDKMRTYVADRMAEISGAFESIRPDQAMVHMDSVEPRIINEKNPAASLDITSVIETLNSQNQSALKTMATVIGRGQNGAGTATVEARIAAMNADELNEPVAEILSAVFSFMLHQQGYQGFCDVQFKKVEMRAELELEPQLTLRASRLLADLSEGLLTDDEYHLMMYSRPRPDSTPELSGTKFYNAGSGIDASKASPNADPMGKSLSSEGSKMAKSNSVKKVK